MTDEKDTRDGVDFPTDEEAGMKEEAQPEQVAPAPVPAPECPYKRITIQFTENSHLEFLEPMMVQYQPTQYIIKDCNGNVIVFPHDYMYMFMELKDELKKS
jgi:hypothetical protein